MSQLYLRTYGCGNNVLGYVMVRICRVIMGMGMGMVVVVGMDGAGDGDSGDEDGDSDSDDDDDKVRLMVGGGMLLYVWW